MGNDLKIRVPEWARNMYNRLVALIDASGGEENVIESISLNGVNVPPDANKNVALAESDPTVPSLAKQNSKPAYTASEVGALPANTPIPSKTSDLTNDSGFLTSTRPDHPCDMWQYTSHGHAPGISNDVDLNVLMGTKPMSFFTGKNESGGENNMAVKIGSARIDENGNAKGGKAGDQTGKEVSTQSWYKHAKGWRVFRAKDPAVAEKIAQDMQWACDNRHIGYDQGQRLTLYDVAKPLGFNCKLVKTNCETDCSALVRVCCAYAGVMLPNFRTPTEPAALLDSGAFVEMKGGKYTDKSDYLKRGDILCTKTQGHTVVVLTDGPKTDVEPEPDPMLGDRTLRKGDSGRDVTELQKDLMTLGYSLPKYGADGDFGSETEKAVKAFQMAYSLTDDGVMNKGKDFDTLFAALDGAKPTGQKVEITGHVNIRTAPGYDSKVIGTAHAGETYPYQGVTKEAEGKPWYLIEYKGVNGWVSSKYAKLVN